MSYDEQPDPTESEMAIERMRGALQAVLDGIVYETPAGTENCRFCDQNMDHEGTYAEMHDSKCIVHQIRAALKAA